MKPTPAMFDVRCEGQNVDITMYGHIGPSLLGDEEGLTAQRVMDVLAANKSATQITLNINSPGGLMFEALAMYNALRRHPARKVVNVDGYAASAASLVAMAGDQINIAANGMMMIHDPINIVLGNAADMRKAAEDLDKQAEPAVTTYVARTGNSAAQVRAWMRDTTWFTADECKTHKFADEITPAKSVAACDLSAYRYAKLPSPSAAAVAAFDSRSPDPGAPTTEKPMPEPKTGAAPEVQAATLAELKTIAGSTPEFREAALESGLTLAQATAMWQREGEAAKASGATKTIAAAAAATDGVREQHAGSSTGGTFLEVASELAERDGISLSAARDRVARQQPQLYAEYRKTRMRRERGLSSGVTNVG